MKKNMGTIDRLLRVLVAIAIFVLYYFAVISGLVAIILLIIAVVFILTSFISICPLYYLLSIRTCAPSES